MPPKKSQQARRQRVRNPKTPAAQTGSDAAYPDEEEGQEEMNAGAMEASSDAPNEGDTAEIDLHLGSDLSNALPAPPDQQDAPDTRRATRRSGMGANQSQEDAYANVRNAGRQLPATDMAPSSGQKKGKLPKPSSSAKTVTMRRLGPSNGIRKSAYDALDSPDKPTLRPNRLENPAAFSPLRNQKKEQQVKQATQPSPRRSARKQAQQDGPEAAAKSHDVVRSRQDHLNGGVEEDVNARYIDRFPDAVVKQYARDEADAAGGADEQDNIDVVNIDDNGRQQDEVALAEQGEKQKNKRGRPPKGGKKADSSHGGNTDTAQHVTAAKTPLRQRELSKSTTRSEPRSSARAQEKYSELAHRHQPDKAQEGKKKPKGNSAAVESTVQSAQRHSRRLQQSGADLRKQKNAHIRGGFADVAGATSGDGQAPTDNQEDGEDLPDKPVVLRISEVQFGGEDVPRDAVDTPEEVIQGSTSGKGKRKATSQAMPANTGAKRKKRAQPDEVEERSEANRKRLWGQWLPLMEVYRNIRHVGCNTKDGERGTQNAIKLKDDDVKAVIKLCTEAEKRYQTLMSPEADYNSDPAGVLQEIGRRIDGLRGRDEDFPTDFDDKRKTTNIYFHLIPALVKLLVQATTSYEVLDEDHAPAGRITKPHLEIVVGIISLALDMEYAADNFYRARPDPKLAVVRSVHNGIAVPLLMIQGAFQNVIRRHGAEEREVRRQQQEAQDRALRLEQEERESRQTAELNRIRKKWEKLHCERMMAEGGLMRPAKIAHLRMPDPNLDVDADGVVFSRVSVFHPRVGPPPGLLDRAKQLVWTEGELRALEDGLKRYAGKMVYERTFRAWCPCGRILNRYNVTEIVAAAELVKEWYEKEAASNGEEVEEWVKLIPVWSKSHALGEENEDSAFVDVDDVGVGASGVATASS